MKLRTALLALLLFAPGSVALAGERGAASITADEIQNHINTLASDAFEGRGTGTRGEHLAAAYIIKKLQAFGLEPGSADGTYLQPFTVTGAPQLQETPALQIQVGPWHRTFTAGDDFVPFSFSASGKVQGQLVFAGYGVTDPSRHYDDYAGLDVKGKVVVVLRHEPREQDGTGEHSYFIRKAQNAKEHGASALLVVTDPLNHEGDESLLPFGAGGGAEASGVLGAHVRQSLITSLFALEGKDLTAIQREIDASLKPHSFALDAQVSMGVKIARQEIQARNVVAKIEGSDPQLKDEVLVLGAHYDHLGLGHQAGSLGGPQAEGQIHNGADDNASGSSGLLELAQAFSMEHPRRTIYLVWFSGEEMGLLGSQHFVEHPPIPQKQIVAMINMDMIGRLRDGSLEVGGAGTSPNFSEIITEAVSAQGLKAKLTPSGYGPSDHASFYAAKIPVMFFFTGLHEDYHKPSDDADKINAAGAEKVARAAFACAEELANADRRPAYVEVPRERERNQNRARMGVMPDQGFGGPGVKLAQVPKGPSREAGLQAGDVVLSVGGVETNDLRGLLEALSTHEPGDQVEVVFTREGVKKTLTVKLGGR